MAIGLCLGGIGVGDCSNPTTSEQSVKVVNTAIAEAYYKNAFSCTSTVQAGDKVNAGGACGCAEIGINNNQTCNDYKLKMAELQATVCTASEANAKQTGMTHEELTCICKVSGASCNIDISQKSMVASQALCQNSDTIQSNLKNNFATDLADKLTSKNSDLGALFDSSDQKNIVDLATTIQDNITQEMTKNITSQVQASNVVTSECGGINMGISQYSQFDNILKALTSSTAIQDASNSLATAVKIATTRRNDGFLGGLWSWMKSSGGIIVIIIICIGVIVAVWMWRNGSFSKSSTPTAPAAAPAAAPQH